MLSTSRAVPLTLFVVLIFSTACNPAGAILQESSPISYNSSYRLKDLADFPVGVAVRSGRLNNSQWQQTAQREFNSITGEYEMQQNIIHPEPNKYNWENTDALLAFAESNGMQIHGHALIWYQSAAGWMHDLDGNPNEMERQVKLHIQTVLEHYKGRIGSWDVVNEALSDVATVARDDIYTRNLGQDFVARCFQYAHEADPSVKLFYNDYGTTWDADKRNALLNMLDDFQARGIPIHGVGLQLHIDFDSPSMSEIAFTVDEIVKRGLLIHFSEVDIKMNPNGIYEALSQEMALIQEERIKQLVEIYKSIPAEQQFGFTFWGLRDSESWLNNFTGHAQWPLLFNEAFQPKLMHRGVVNGLMKNGL